MSRAVVTGGEPTYQERVRAEIARYEEIFRGRMNQAAPRIWGQVEEYFADLVEKVTGVRNLYQYVARHARGRQGLSVLGLGSGACGNELDGIAPLLKEQGCAMDLTCMDINSTILEQARGEAQKRGVNFSALTMDANTMVLEPNRYDVIVAYAALHHFLKLDHVAQQINRALKPDGIFVSVDIPTRNGYRMWDESLAVVNHIWSVLPPKYKMEHVAGGTPVYVETFANINYAVDGFECINSQAIVPALRAHLRELHYVPGMCICRRFFDARFGANYDVDNPADMAIFKFVLALDTYYSESGLLRPETFFGAYAKK